MSKSWAPNTMLTVPSGGTTMRGRRWPRAKLRAIATVLQTIPDLHLRRSKITRCCRNYPNQSNFPAITAGVALPAGARPSVGGVGDIPVRPAAAAADRLATDQAAADGQRRRRGHPRRRPRRSKFISENERRSRACCRNCGPVRTARSPRPARQGLVLGAGGHAIAAGFCVFTIKRASFSGSKSFSSSPCTRWRPAARRSPHCCER